MALKMNQLEIYMYTPVLHLTQSSEYISKLLNSRNVKHFMSVTLGLKTGNCTNFCDISTIC